MLVGRHGIGKSEIIKQFYASLSMPFIPFFLGQMSDPGDLIGLLHKDEANSRSEFLPPAWWPSDGQPVVLFLDELNRGRPEVLQSVMELTLSKTLAGKSLPHGSVIVSAVNDGDEYQLTDLDPALVSRFNVYHFQPRVEEWIGYATKVNLDPRVIDFVQDSPHWLDGEPTVANQQRYDLAIEKSPDRRGWTRVAGIIASIETLDELTFKLIAGIVGGPAAAAFRTFIASRLPVAADDIIDGDQDAIAMAVTLSTEQIARLCENMVRSIANRTGGAPNSGVSGSGVPNSGVPTGGVLDFLGRLVDQGQRESVAHFVSLSQRPSSGGVADWIASSIDLSVLVSQYIDSIAPSST